MRKAIVTAGIVSCPRGLVVACLVLVGCARPAPPAPSAPPAPPTHTDASAGASARLADVELLDPGREPRAALRYAFQAGTHEPYVTISTDEIGTQGPIRAYSSSDVQVEVVLPDGSARLDVALRRATYDGEPADHRKLHLDARGRLVDDGTADNSLPADTLLVARPVEPVGVGARWRTRRPHAASSTITYELRAVEPGGAHVSETAIIFEKGVGVGNSMEWERESTIERTGDLHVAWNRVVPRADWDVKEFGSTRTHGIPGTQGGAPDRTGFGGMTFHTSIVPAGALAPPAFFPGDLGPVLMAMMPLWLPTGLPLCAAPQGPLSGAFATRYPGGTPAVAGTCKDGRPDGDWTWWDEAGDAISLGHFRVGRPDGTWKQRSRGHELGSFTLRDGTGEVIAWWPGGGKRLEIDFVGGIPHGQVASWRADGTRELEGHFENPRGQGTWTEFDARGTVIRTWTLNEAGSLPH